MAHQLPRRPSVFLCYDQGWVFAMAKSIFARTVEKTVKTAEKKQAKTATYKIVQKHPNWGN